MAYRRRLLAAAAWLAMATGCGGGGCDCMQPIPQGFPSAARVPNAVQIRITQTGLETIESDPAGLIAGLVGGDMGLTFDIPPACSEGDNPAMCCEPIDGPVIEPCGPVAIDLEEQPGDLPRFELNPIEGGNRLDLTVRARVSTVSDLVIWYDTGLFFKINCGVAIDTEAAGPNDDLLITTTIDLIEDAEAGTTRIVVGDVNISQLDDGDLSLIGAGYDGFLCDFANLLIGLFTDSLIDGIGGTLKDQIEGAVCKSCPSGDVAECGEFADACDSETCMKGGECLQEVGLSGRLLASAVLGSLSPGQPGSIDLYLVAGGDGKTDANGLTLNMFGGMVPGDVTARCGPPADPPADVAIPESAFFQGNTRPDTGNPFDVGIGVHQLELDQFAWSGYEGGFLCLTIGTNTVDLLNSDTLAILMPSLIDLLHGETGQLYLGLRPQQPPTIPLGLGTFTEGGDIDEPLLDITFANMEIDFFAMVDDQLIRVMTMKTDVHLPIGLEVTPDGELQPVLGDVSEAFTNITVSNSRALLETPEELADRLPAVLSVALPFLGDALAAIALPDLGGLKIVPQQDGITAVDNKTFLGIFADLEFADPMAARVDTRAELVAVHMPERAAYLAPTLDRNQRPVVELLLDGVSETGARLEWQFRIDNGLWSPYTRNSRVYLSRDVFWLVGNHVIEVRAREVGKPLTADKSPVVLAPVIDTTPSLLPEIKAQSPSAVIGFHGRAQSDGGCSCRIATNEDRRTGRGTAAGACLLLAGLLFVRRRRRRGRSLPGWFLAALLAGALMSPAGCSCGSDAGDDCGPDGCLEGEVEPGPTGRYSDIDADGNRTVISAYEETLGDLVLLELDGEGNLNPTIVDGVPADAVSTYDPDTYRRGVVEAGANVGAYTSVALHDGLVHIAYQDIDAGQLKYARETVDDTWAIHTVDTMEGVSGLYTSLAFNSSGNPSISYMATGIDDGAGGRKSQLRIAQASATDPSSGADWTVTVLDEAPIPCTGLCGAGEACVAETLLCKAIGSGCDDCGSGDECIEGACTTVLVPVAYDIPEGTGMFTNLAFLADGRPIIVYYDRATGDLVLQENNGSWNRVEIDAAPETDTGMWATIAVDGSTVHIAYQDALRDRLLYTTWDSGSVGPVEVVDDGQRNSDRPHHVGAGAALVLDAQGLPALVYQDGAAVTLQFARRDSTGTWTRGDLMSGAELYGFYNALVVDGGAVRVSSYIYDRIVFPPGELRITTLP